MAGQTKGHQFNQEQKNELSSVRYGKGQTLPASALGAQEEHWP